MIAAYHKRLTHPDRRVQAEAAAVREILADAGLVGIATVQDLEHRDRVTLGRAP